jgi:tetratricopeptide (TPR) repeat protein
MKKRYWILFALSLLAGRNAFAHGELLIRIAEVTQQINTATNKTAQLYLERAELYRMDQNWPAAEADYAQADTFGADPVKVDCCHAGMLADAGQFQAACALFDKVLERAPQDGEALVGRARARLKLGQRKAAIIDFKRGLGLLADPSSEDFVQSAEALATEGKVAEALQTLDIGIKKLGPVPALQTPAIDLELSRKGYDRALARIDTVLPQLLRKENWLARRGDVLLAARLNTEACQSYKDSLAAITALPLRVRQSPPMLSLKSRVEEALSAMIDGSGSGKTPTGLASAESNR